MSANLTQALLKHNQQVPRYTSYPTANHFTDTHGANDGDDWLSTIDEGTSVSLYFHVPFCKEICWYCGCHTKASKQYTPVEEFLSYLKKEVSLVAKKLGARRKVSHIHFGGGSPSYMAANDFSDLMEHVFGLFSIEAGAEIAVEIDPRELTELKVAAYRKAGVNRASLGVQDFHEDVQCAIGREQPVHQIYKAVQLLRDYDINHINMDLLYGLPKQTTASIRENIEMALALAPSRISLFGYAHVPWMKKHMRLIDESALPNGSDRLEQFAVAADALTTKGYIQIGLDHFVKPDDPMATAHKKRTLVRNFQGYSTDSAPIMIGFGPSAISDFEHGYLQNTLANHTYYAALDAGKLATAKGVPVLKDDAIVRRLIEQFMCYMELDLHAFTATEGLTSEHFSTALQKLDPLVQDGLVTREQGLVRINPAAPQAVRLVCAAFDPRLQVSQKKHAQVA